VLREQVPPPTPRPPAPTSAQALTIADPGLPARDPQRAPRWRLNSVPRGAVDGVAGPQHLVYTRASEDQMELTVRRSDTGEQLVSHAVPNEDAPWSSLLHDGLLLVAHGRQQVRLDVIDPATGEVREFEPPAGYSFRPRLVDLGDEVLLLGWHTDPRQSCVLAVQPRTGATRVAWCAEQSMVPAWLYAGVDEVVWPAVGPSGCLQWQRLQPGGQAQPVPPTATLCGARALINLAGWQVAQHPERDALQPMIVASDGSRQLALGTAAGFVGCGRHVYWSAATQGIDPDTVYRWLPGADYREVAYRLELSDRLALAAPRCTDGVLSVAVTTAHGGDPRLVELLSLGRP